MSESFIENLSRFTPDAGELNRDSLLYAAGRASARPNRTWIALVAALSSTQALTLALLWLRPAPPIANLPETAIVQPSFTSPDEPSLPESLDSSSQLSVRRSLLESEMDDLSAPVETGTFVESKPLRAFAIQSSSLLN